MKKKNVIQKQKEMRYTSRSSKKSAEPQKFICTATPSKNGQSKEMVCTPLNSAFSHQNVQNINRAPKFKARSSNSSESIEICCTGCGDSDYGEVRYVKATSSGNPQGNGTQSSPWSTWAQAEADNIWDTLVLLHSYYPMDGGFNMPGGTRLLGKIENGKRPIITNTTPVKIITNFLGAYYFTGDYGPDFWFLKIDESTPVQLDQGAVIKNNGEDVGEVLGFDGQIYVILPYITGPIGSIANPVSFETIISEPYTIGNGIVVSGGECCIQNVEIRNTQRSGVYIDADADIPTANATSVTLSNVHITGQNQSATVIDQSAIYGIFFFGGTAVSPMGGVHSVLKVDGVLTICNSQIKDNYTGPAIVDIAYGGASRQLLMCNSKIKNLTTRNPDARIVPFTGTMIQLQPQSLEEGAVFQLTTDATLNGGDWIISEDGRTNYGIYFGDSNGPDYIIVDITRPVESLCETPLPVPTGPVKFYAQNRFGPGTQNAIFGITCGAVSAGTVYDAIVKNSSIGKYFQSRLPDGFPISNVEGLFANACILLFNVAGGDVKLHVDKCKLRDVYDEFAGSRGFLGGDKITTVSTAINNGFSDFGRCATTILVENTRITEKGSGTCLANDFTLLGRNIFDHSDVNYKFLNNTCKGHTLGLEIIPEESVVFIDPETLEALPDLYPELELTGVFLGTMADFDISNNKFLDQDYGINMFPGGDNADFVTKMDGNTFKSNSGNLVLVQNRGIFGPGIWGSNILNITNNCVQSTGATNVFNNFPTSPLNAVVNERGLALPFEFVATITGFPPAPFLSTLTIDNVVQGSDVIEPGILIYAPGLDFTAEIVDVLGPGVFLIFPALENPPVGSITFVNPPDQIIGNVVFNATNNNFRGHEVQIFDINSSRFTVLGESVTTLSTEWNVGGNFWDTQTPVVVFEETPSQVDFVPILSQKIPSICGRHNAFSDGPKYLSNNFRKQAKSGRQIVKAMQSKGMPSTIKWNSSKFFTLKKEIDEKLGRFDFKY